MIELLNREHPGYRAKREVWQRYQDFYMGGEQLRRNAGLYLTRHGKHRGGVEVYGDASGGHGHTVTGKSDYHLIRQFFRRHPELRGEVYVSSANPPVRDRVNVANSRIRNAQGERHLFVDAQAKELIKDFEQVCYKPGTSQIDKERDSKRSHLSDALGYYLWWRYRPLEKVGERDRRLM